MHINTHSIILHIVLYSPKNQPVSGYDPRTLRPRTSQLLSLDGEVTWQIHAAVDGTLRHTLDCVDSKYHRRAGEMMSLTVESVLMLQPYLKHNGFLNTKK